MRASPCPDCPGCPMCGNELTESMCGEKLECLHCGALFHREPHKPGWDNWLREYGVYPEDPDERPYIWDLPEELCP